MPLKPVERRPRIDYPHLGRRALEALLLALTLGATSLAGCAGAIDTQTLDENLGSGDLDAAVCDGDQDCDR